MTELKNPFTHGYLVTHGLTTDNANEYCVAFELKLFAKSHPMEVVNVFKLTDVLPDAHNTLLASIHNYQMVARNMIGLQHLLKEIDHAVLSKDISQPFYKELSSKLEQLLDLNAMTMRITLEGQENVANDMKLNVGPKKENGK